MKRLAMGLLLIALGTGAFAQSATGMRNGKGHWKGKKHKTHQTRRWDNNTNGVLVYDRNDKRNVNRAGKVNNGDNGDWRNNKGRGDGNNKHR